MSKHKSEDYKISAVKYYLNNDVSLDDVYEINDCPILCLDADNFYTVNITNLWNGENSVFTVKDTNINRYLKIL